MPIHHWLIYRTTWWFIWVLNFFLFRTRYIGLKELPKDKPYLLLPNHSSMLDPFWVAHPMYRPSRFMGSTQLLNIPFLGSFLKILGTFPKKKFTKDKESMQTLQDFYDQGYVITLFPEGNRCWDGTTGNILPGIGRLIKRMDANVVYARMTSAHFFQPRWAKYPRWVPIEITYDGPYTYPQHMTEEEITQEVIQHLSLTASFPKGPSLGYRMAEGLEQYLWACPTCLTPDSLSVPTNNGNEIYCNACGARWDVDTSTKLTGSTQTTVRDAALHLKQHFGTPPVIDPETFEAKQIALGPLSCTLWLHLKGQPPEQITEGHLTLQNHTLIIQDKDETMFRKDIEDIRAISVEVGNRLFFRTEEKLFRISCPNDSVIKIDYFLRKWRLHKTGLEY